MASTIPIAQSRGQNVRSPVRKGGNPDIHSGNQVAARGVTVPTVERLGTARAVTEHGIGRTIADGLARHDDRGAERQGTDDSVPGPCGRRQIGFDGGQGYGKIVGKQTPDETCQKSVLRIQQCYSACVYDHSRSLPGSFAENYAKKLQRIVCQADENPRVVEKE